MVHLCNPRFLISCFNIMPEQPKRKPVTPKKQVKRKYYTPVRHKKPGVMIRLLRKIPSWVLWLGGALIVLVYICFFYYFFVGPFGFRWRALYGDVTYPEGYDIRGIDISHYQGKIDWALLRNSGLIEKSPVRFVMIKATEGSDRIDVNFKDNFHNAREFGFIRGAYHFWSNKSGAKLQAKHFINCVKLDEGDLPPVLDVEHKPKHMSVKEFQDSLKCWLNIVEKHYDTVPILYTFYKFKKEYLNDTIFDRYHYWIAHYYVDSVEYEGAWKFWQHTDCGRLPGIKDYVDLNIFNGSLSALDSLLIK